MFKDVTITNSLTVAGAVVGICNNYERSDGYAGHNEYATISNIVVDGISISYVYNSTEPERWHCNGGIAGQTHYTNILN